MTKRFHASRLQTSHLSPRASHRLLVLRIRYMNSRSILDIKTYSMHIQVLHKMNRAAGLGVNVPLPIEPDEMLPSFFLHASNTRLCIVLLDSQLLAL